MSILTDKQRKIFVLDTNVILYDYTCIYSFEEHNVVIPITVLEEIDKFKRGSEIINYNAREFTRELDSLVGEGFLNEGIQLDTGGMIIVNTDIRKDDHIGALFWEDQPDHRILAVSYNLAGEYGKARVVIVSKDINLRMKAKSIGIQAADYETGKIKSIDELYKGKALVEGLKDKLIEEMGVGAAQFLIDDAEMGIGWVEDRRRLFIVGRRM